MDLNQSAESLFEANETLIDAPIVGKKAGGGGGANHEAESMLRELLELS